METAPRTINKKLVVISFVISIVLAVIVWLWWPVNTPTDSDTRSPTPTDETPSSSATPTALPTGPVTVSVEKTAEGVATLYLVHQQQFDLVGAELYFKIQGLQATSVTCTSLVSCPVAKVNSNGSISLSALRALAEVGQAVGPKVAIATINYTGTGTIVINDSGLSESSIIINNYTGNALNLAVATFSLQ